MSLILLDTSALAAPFFHEPGEAQVSELLSRSDLSVAVCAISWFEFRFLLRARGVSDSDARETLDLYRGIVSRTLPIDEETVWEAIRLRETVSDRIPMSDALIAGCAIHHEATLVHRDRHLDAISPDLLRTTRVG